MMLTSTRTLQILFGAAVFVLVLASISSGASSSQSGAIRNVFHGNIHLSKLWPWVSGGSEGGNTWVREHLRRSERNYQEMIAQRADLDAAYHDAGLPTDLFPCTSAKKHGQVPFTVWDYASPAFNCPHSVKRLGRLGDGGKWVCGIELLEAIPPRAHPDHPASCVVYSFGINHESSFEDAILSRTQGCEVWGYDFDVADFGPQLNRSAPYYARAHFTRAGIAGKTDTQHKDGIPFYSIQDLMKKNGHDHIDVLKMDIEGAEFDVMQSIISAFRLPPGSKPNSKSGQQQQQQQSGIIGLGGEEYEKEKQKQKKRQVEAGVDFFYYENSADMNGGDGDEDDVYDYDDNRDGILDALEKDDGLGEVPIAQLMIEIHLEPMGPIKDTPSFMKWWETLEDAGFRAVFTEPNLLVSTLPLWDSYPRYAEYTFINIKDSRSLLTK